ncbi:serine/threonine-protein kinase SRK2J-like isoform X2 [Quercus lobata]|uniref:serine/threonine-protein kinase SRK2J-like isoform X2 n=1 Tax=Quercus lobata TaxID=97700 RepID=UPI001248C03F|nr:serine/threonine-protein kinase SRK2J-like isoform X2 [Quercus lobata]
MEMYKQVIYLGYGSFGEVWLVENKKTTELFAMKCIQCGQQIDNYVAREIIIQKSLYHPNVIQFKEIKLTSLRDSDLSTFRVSIIY